MKISFLIQENYQLKIRFYSVIIVDWGHFVGPFLRISLIDLRIMKILANSLSAWRFCDFMGLGICGRRLYQIVIRCPFKLTRKFLNNCMKLN